MCRDGVEGIIAKGDTVYTVLRNQGMPCVYSLLDNSNMVRFGSNISLQCAEIREVRESRKIDHNLKYENIHLKKELMR